MPAEAAEQLDRLLTALVAEDHPPTAIRGRDQALAAHLADSLSGLEVPALCDARSIADVGAGAGFPGLPLAIALPGARVDLLEASRRRARVIDRLIRAGAVGNARAIVARAEDWAAAPAAAGGGREAYVAVTARAVAALAVLAEYAAPLLVRGGVLVAWKGAPDAVEERDARAAAEALGMAIESVRAVTPFEGARRRRLYVLRKLADTPPGIPRRPGMARKRPLG